MATMIEKQNWIVTTLRYRRRMTLQEIQQRWSDSAVGDGKPLCYRTLNRHINAIKDTYNIQIKCDKSTNEYYIENIAEMEEGSIKNWLLDTIATDSLVSECKSLSERILFEQVPGGREHINTIVDAMKGNFALEMTYEPFCKEAYTTKVRPYFLKANKQRWYLVCDCDRHPGQKRVFGLDRIKELKRLDEKFRYPKDFSPEAYSKQFFGIFMTDSEDIKPEFVKIVATGMQQDYLRSLPLHSSQEIIDEGPGYTMFSYWLVPGFDFEQELISRFEDIEVREPLWLRDKIKIRLEKMLGNYR